MLPILKPDFTVDTLYQDYLNTLKQSTFSGEIRADYASRMAVATDNSIYQVIPQAVILPKTIEDISIALKIGSEQNFQPIKFSPRGGGMSTNGQSLSNSIIIDCSKYMCSILEINLQENWIRVQPGVVQDQLNAFLLPYGMHFAPEISPSNRATLGGMINTDACGNGQKLIGRTSDHIADLTYVMANGDIFSTENPTFHIADEIAQLLRDHQSEIQAIFPKAPRTLSGYNLLKAYTDKLNLNYLLSGSEGTLAVIGEAKLKITPIPQYKKLVVLQYSSFDDALQALNINSDIKPLVIECVDEALLDLARQDPIYFSIKNFIEHPVKKTAAINLVEFIANDEQTIEEQIKQLSKNVDAHTSTAHYAIGYQITKDTLEIKKLWELRKKAVGLISKAKQGSRSPIPFIEDTAVHPEKLMAYIQEFKKILDAYQLTYGMYGHIDAGCVHVRPALDLQLIEDRVLHEKLSKDIMALVKKYDGVMWGEHGMGFRSEFNKAFFGEKLYSVVRKIKTLFDPCNKLNPGKIAIPYDCDEELMTLAGPLRAEFDEDIPKHWQQEYPSAMACNGNGACFNYATQEVMCPSFKVTKDRIHSPKGRAVLFREWLRQLANQHYYFKKNYFIFLKKIFAHKDKNDFSHEVFAAFNGCLSCQACTAQCPLNVDIPELKAKFLEFYFQRYFRPIRDYLIASIESIAYLQASLPGFFTKIINLKFSRWILYKIGLIDVPTISSISINKELKKRNAPEFNLKLLSQLTTDQKEKSVIILQDAFTSFYHPELLLSAYDLLTYLGYSVYIAPFFKSGKPYHVKGFLRQFYHIAKRNIRHLNQIAKTKISIIGLDPSITLTYRNEYQKIAHAPSIIYQILLPQEWLQKKIITLPQLQSQKSYYLLSHCTEKAVCIAAEKQWMTVFAALGLRLTPLAVGCCGMAGSYGHETEHLSLSHDLFNMDWLNHIKNKDENAVILATGYSCQSQVSRFLNLTLMHPLEALKQLF